MQIEHPRSAGRPGAARALALAVSILLLAAAPQSPPRRAAPAPRPGRAPNVVLITLDTTRADRLGCYGAKEVRTPNLDRLAAHGVLFENAVSTTPLTLPAHVSMMTGLEPGRSGMRDNRGAKLAADHRTLASLLKAHGYVTGGFVSAYVLDHRWGIAQGFDRYLDDFPVPRNRAVNMEEIQRRGDETVREAMSWVREQATRGAGGPRGSGGGALAPIFAWIHLYDPHAPYAPPEPFATQYEGRPYDGEVAWTDALVGRVLDGLEQMGIADRTIVVVLADHGESLGEHGETGHGYFLYGVTTRVPFLVAGPGAGRGGLRVREVVGIVDLAPTVLALAGFAPEKEAALRGIDGRSLVPVIAAARAAGTAGKARPAAQERIGGYSETFYARYHFGWSELRAVRSERFHFIEAPRPELYDVTSDPGELTNRAALLPDVVATMRKELARHESGSSKAPDLDDEAAERLAALGYAGGVAPTEGKSYKELPDPKDRIRIYNLFLRSQEELGAGATDKAIATLQELTAADGGVVDAWQMLGGAHTLQGDYSGANKAYRRALEAGPDSVQSAIGLCEVLAAGGELQQGIDLCRGFNAAHPGSSLVHHTLGKLLIHADQLGDAESEFTEALRLAPDLAESAYDIGVIRERRSDFTGAESWFRKAFTIDPRYHEAHAALARRRYAAGDKAGAEAEIKAALALDPGNPVYRKALEGLVK